MLFPALHLHKKWNDCFGQNQVVLNIFMAISPFEKGLDEVWASRGVGLSEPSSSSTKPSLLLCEVRVRWESMGYGRVQVLLIASKVGGEKDFGKLVCSLGPLAMDK